MIETSICHMANLLTGISCYLMGFAAGWCICALRSKE